MTDDIFQQMLDGREAVRQARQKLEELLENLTRLEEMRQEALELGDVALAADIEKQLTRRQLAVRAATTGLSILSDQQDAIEQIAAAKAREEAQEEGHEAPSGETLH